MLLLLVAGCSQPQAEPPPSVLDPTTLVVAKPSDPVVLDPALVTDLESLQVCTAFSETLLRFAPPEPTEAPPEPTEAPPDQKSPDATPREPGAVRPGLAESWSVDPDGTGITFTLRTEVEFHDGTPLDAEAVVLNFERQNSPDHPLRTPGDHFFYWHDVWGSPSRITSIEARDSHTVRIELAEPVAALEQNFALPFFAILSPGTLKAERTQRLRSPAGTGPYRLTEWRPGVAVELAAWGSYWGGRPALERLIFRTVPDSTARELRLRKGDVQLATALSPQGSDGLRARGSVELEESPSLAVSYLAMNHQHPALAQLDVRRAILEALDRDALVQALYYGRAVRANGPLPPGVLGHSFTTASPYRPDSARRRLEALGYGPQNRLKLSLWYMSVPRSYLPEPKALAEAVAFMLEQVHIEVRLEPIDWGVYLDRVGRGEHDLALAGWIGDYPEPDNFLSFMFGGFNVDAEAGGTNLSMYRNPELDALLTQARRVRQPQERSHLYRRAVELLAADAVWAPIAFPNQLLGRHPRLQGVELEANGGLRLGQAAWDLPSGPPANGDVAAPGSEAPSSDTSNGERSKTASSAALKEDSKEAASRGTAAGSAPR